MSEAALPLRDQASAHRSVASWQDLLALLLFLLLGIGVVLYPYTTGREIPGDLGDARFNLALLEFFYRTLLAAFADRSTDFLDAPFYYPWPRVTNFSDTHWGDAEFYALIRALGVDLIASFQLWFVAAFALTYLAAFVSLRMLNLRSWGAAVGAFLFAFSLPMAAHFDHVQLAHRLWVPPSVVAFHRLLTRRSLRAGAACVLFIALQLAISIYLGLFLCLLLASYGAALCLLARDHLVPLRAALRRPGAGELITAGTLLVLGLVVLAIVAIPYLDVQSMYGFDRSWDEVVGTLPRFSSYLLAGASQLWPNLSARSSLPFVEEHQIFPGLAAFIPLAWFLLSTRARTRQPLAAPMIATVVILFGITIDLGGHTLYRLIYAIPGFSALRAVTRIILVMMLPLAALLGMMIDDLVATRGNHLFRSLVAVTLSAFLVAECSLIDRYSTSPSVWRARFDALEAHLPKKLPPHAVLAIASGPLKPGDIWPWILAQTDADLAAVTLGMSTLNGYSGNVPPTWRTMASCQDIGDNLRAGRHFLAEHGIAPPRITQDSLVLVGFDDACEPFQFARDPSLQLGRAYDFAPGADGNRLLAGGFSSQESWGHWTDGKDAFLFFSLETVPTVPITVAIEATSLSPAADRKQVVDVAANGQACGQLVVSVSHPQAAVTCPAGALHTDNNMLRLRITRPARPKDVGLNIDGRLLGLAMKTLTLTPKE
jgi:hypothetical protein